MRAPALPVLLGALLLAGCGSDRPQPATGGDAGQITVTETDFKLSPAGTSVAAGAVSITVENAGKTPHALALETTGKLKATSTIEPGRSATLKADLEPGRYTWYCPVGNHRQLGMTGTLTVGGKATETEPSAPAAPSGGYSY